MITIKQIQLTPEDADPFKRLLREAFSYNSMVDRGSGEPVQLIHTGIYDALSRELQKLANEAFKLGAESVNCD